jgi:hypothetical protein
LTFFLVSEEWKIVTGPNPFPSRTEHTSIVVDSKVYIVGGYSGVGGYKMDVVCFDLGTLHPMSFFFPFPPFPFFLSISPHFAPYLSY